MCRRLIINAGISQLVIRDTQTEYRIVDVEKEWIEEDESLPSHLREGQGSSCSCSGGCGGGCCG